MYIYECVVYCKFVCLYMYACIYVCIQCMCMYVFLLSVCLYIIQHIHIHTMVLLM